MDARDVDELERLLRTRRIGRRGFIDRLLLLGGVAALAGPGSAILAACGGQPPAGGGGSQTTSGFPAVDRSLLGRKITLHVLLAQDYAQEAPFNDLYAAFRKAYPDIVLNVDNAVWEDIPTKVKTAALGGTLVPAGVEAVQPVEQGQLEASASTMSSAFTAYDTVSLSGSLNPHEHEMSHTDNRAAAVPFERTMC